MQHFIYKSQHIQFDQNNDNDNNESIIMFKKLIKDEKHSSQDKFYNINDDNNELIVYIDKLKTLKIGINDFRNKDLKTLNDILTNNNSQSQNNEKEKLLTTLSEKYYDRYIETINQGNAVAYNEYIKYTSPKDNKYYKQYL